MACDPIDIRFGWRSRAIVWRHSWSGCWQRREPTRRYPSLDWIQEHWCAPPSSSSRLARNSVTLAMGESIHDVELPEVSWDAEAVRRALLSYMEQLIEERGAARVLF